jgi:hypothetical protein
MRIAVLFLLSLAPLGQAGSPDYFTPAHRVSGIGVERDDISDDLLAVRTDLMIQSQTFAIMRDPEALAGAKRITGNLKLQQIFRAAERDTGVPATLIEAIAYLESWGDSRRESPTGPKGIMQISGATARSMGLRVLVSTRYRVTRERVLVSGKGKKARYKTITHKTPYLVTSRDDRMYPERAIPAAARYFSGMERKYGSRDWAIFAYHCGQGCVNEMMELTRRARGVPKDKLTVARMFFSNNPAWNRELYDAIQQQMQRDYSPTYYFRIIRAEQLLAMYRRDPDGFAALTRQYRSDFTPANIRAPHRLAVWLKRDDLLFKTGNDIRLDPSKRLTRAVDHPEYLGYSLRLLTGGGPLTSEDLSEASPAALGALAYIAFETHRLFDAMKPRDQKYVPLPVTALVEPEDFARGKREGLAHTSGQVFDIDYSGLPPAEAESLRFVLNDLGWAGYLGFVEEDSSNLHIGPSPMSRDFFSSVFHESVGKRAEELANQN